MSDKPAYDCQCESPCGHLTCSVCGGSLAEGETGAAIASPGVPDVCGAQDWGYDDEEEIIIYGTCQRPAGHTDRWHQEMRDGKLWAEWSGPSDERAPCKTSN